MNILALDTSSRAASCALSCEGRLVGEYYTDAGLTHSQTVMPMLEQLLAHTGHTLPEVDIFAVSTGPGSFTGLRIGIAAVKGMAQALDKPCAAVSTLEGLAWNATEFAGYVLPALDARCSQVYAALFENSPGSDPRRLWDDDALTLDQLAPRLRELADKPILLVGDGAALCKQHFTELDNLFLAPPAHRLQHASGLLGCALRLDRENKLTDPRDLVPAYLRLPQAQRELMAKEAANNKEELQ